MGVAVTGTPVTGSISLTNGAPSGTFALFTVMGQAAYTLAGNERVYITSLTISSNDSAGLPLVTVDTGGTTPTKLASQYSGATNYPPVSVSFPMGSVRGIFGVVPRASASAITAAKTVEVTVTGYVART